MLVLFHTLSAFVDLLNDEKCNSIPQNSMKVFRKMLILIQIISAFVDLLVLFDILIAIVKVIHGLNRILLFSKIS
jgi:hypothetical protein